MDHEIYEWFPKAERRIINKYARGDLHPRVYVFSLCNQKVRAIIVQPTMTETKGNDIDFPGYTTLQGCKRSAKVHNLLGKVSLPELNTYDVEELDCQGLSPYRGKRIKCQSL